MRRASSGLRDTHDEGAPGGKSKDAGPVPDERALREAALVHLGRYEATRDGLVRVLDRRVARWALRAGAAEPETIEAARAAARRVADALVVVGAVDDARFAARRASLHARSGRSARASRALLTVAGVAAPLADTVAARDADMELGAAVAHARKRRLGPFARPSDDPRQHRRALASFARAGFASDIARQALALDIEGAESLLGQLKARD